METIDASRFRKIACAGDYRLQPIAPFVQDASLTNGIGRVTEWEGSVSLSAATDPGPASLYRSAWRTDGTAFPIGYTIVGLVPLGSYKLRFHFTALPGEAAGQQVINASIVGETTVTIASYDPFVAAGNQTARATIVERTLNADATGTIVFNVTAAATKLATLCGFEISVSPPAVETPLSDPSPTAPSVTAPVANPAASAPSVPTPTSDPTAVDPSAQTPVADPAASAPSVPTPISDPSPVAPAVSDPIELPDPVAPTVSL